MPELNEADVPPGRATEQPAALAGRIASIDILRGVAVFGILVENMLFFLGPRVQWELTVPLWPGPLDRIIVGLIHWLEEGKMYSLYALLFGLGLGMQFERSGAGGSIPPLAIRRLLALLGIGLVHGLLIWWGDILTVYALLGFVLLLFMRWSDRALVGLAGAAWLVPAIFFGLVWGTIQFAPAATPADWANQSAARQAALLAEVETAQQIHTRGDWLEAARLRWHDFAEGLTDKAVASPSIFLMFLLGVWAARRRIAVRDARTDPLLRRLLHWCLPIGLVLHAPYAYLAVWGSATPLPGEIAAMGALMCAGLPLVTLGYAAGLMRWAQSAAGQRWLSPLRAVGEMSLTNYLMHSIVGALLAGRIGLGLYGRVSPALCVVFAVGLYALQIPFSNWWLSRFRFGPAEWAWRTAAYARRQPWLRGPG